MRGLLARGRSFWRGIRRPGQVDAEMEEEMRFHIEMEASRLQRERGLSAREALRQAGAAFGGTEKYKELGRDARGLSGVAGLSLDLRLARRMLVKSPGLTLVGGLAMAVAIAVGAGFFAFIHALVDPRLPLPEGDRIVALENWDVRASNEERRSLHDFAAWRAGMRSVEQISAFRMVQRQLIGGGALPAPAEVAEMTASAFRAARVPPLLGRYILEEDERDGAPRVAVIGYDLWRTRFAGDARVVGRRILLGDTSHTVVGVMPKGFAFPMDHALWTPLRADAGRHPPGEGPEIFVFGRLAPGATAEQAQAELGAIGRRASAASPATHARLRPQILPYTYPLDDIQEAHHSAWQFVAMQFLVSLLLVGVAVNVAVLVYARTAMRRGEIAVRTALGASRRRIVAQLFVEALLLSAGAATLGLGIAHLALRQVKLQMERVMLVGFWVDFRLSVAEVAFVAGLAVLAAVVSGVLPALQATGRHLQSDLRLTDAGAGKGLGRTWTVLIVVQVAVAVAVLPAAVSRGWHEIRGVAVRPTFAADEFLSAGLHVATELRPGMDGEAYRAETAARLGDRLTELLRRLEGEPAVSGATFTATLPGRTSEVQVERIPAPHGHWAPAVGAGPGYFGLFGARTLTGRGFHAGDASANTVIVSRSFVRQLLGDGPALGRRIRFVPPDGEVQPGSETWYEIVGVVEDLRENPVQPEMVPSYVYYPVAPGLVQRASVIIRVRGGDAVSFIPRLRELVAAVDPQLQLTSPRSLAEVERPPLVRVIEAAILLVVASVLLLSAAGIHALMSFAVTRRRKEIGIRTALGASPRRLLVSIFSRALGQLAAGGAAGCILGSALLVQSRVTAGQASFILAFVAILMLGTGVAAAVGPARRGLRIQPMEALKTD